jgi:WD40 repeat protein
MGVVYKARQLGLNRLVAIKMILAADHADEADFLRFRSEAEAVARLHHPNIVQIHEIGETGGIPYFSLEFVDGGSLDRVLQGKPQPQRDAALLVQALAATMHYAHQHRVLHRDLKPANILLSRVDGAAGAHSTVMSATGKSTSVGLVAAPSELYGVPKIADFGLAKQEDDHSGKTRSGTVLGTASYMAPEQALGQIHTLGPPADVYSLGAILYEMLTGRPPFRGASILETLDQVRHREPVPPSQLQPKIPRDLETICLKALEKSTARRYASAAELADDLDRYLSDKPILARPVSRSEHFWRWCRRNPVVAVLAITCALVFAIGFAGVTWQWREAANNLEAANAAEIRATTNAKEATRERNAAVDARLTLQRQSSRLLFRRGWELCAGGKEDEGVHWFTESLRLAPNEEQDQVWHSVVRSNLSGWGRRIHALQHQIEMPQNVMDVAFSPDGKMLVTGSMEGLIHRFDVQSGEPIGEPIAFDITRTGWSGVWTLAFHPSGEWLLAGVNVDAAAGNPGFVQRINAHSGKPIGERVYYSQPIVDVAISPDGKTYAVGCSDNSEKGRVVLQSTDNTPRGEGVPFAERYVRLTFSRDGLYLMISASHGEGDPITEVSVVEVATEKAIVDSVKPADSRFFSHALEDTVVMVEGLKSPIHFQRSDLAGSEGYLVERRGENYGRLLPVRMRSRPEMPGQRPATTLLRPLYTWRHTVAISRQLDTVIAHNWGINVAQVIDVGSRTLRCPPIHFPSKLLSVAMSPHGDLCATGTTAVSIWEVATGKPRLPPLPHPHEIGVMAFSPDGKVLAAGDYAKRVILWDVETGRLIEPVLEQRDIVISLAFSPDGKKLAVGTASDWNHDPQAVLWDLTTGQPIGEPMRHKDYVHHVEFSVDGRRLLTTSSDATIRVWDTDTAQPVGNPIPYTREVSAARFSPNGKMILAGSETGDVRGWDAVTGKPVPGAVAEGPSLVTALAFCRDGSRFAVGYSNGTSQLFDAREFQPLGPPAYQGSSIRAIALTDNGDSWTTVLSDGTPRTWHAPEVLQGPVDEIAEVFRFRTGLAIDENQMGTKLSLPEWRELRDKLIKSNVQLNGLRRLTDSQWHDARARDAEDNGEWPAAQRHLDRLIASAPDEWLPYARRAHTYSRRGEFKAAASDYARVKELLDATGDDQPLDSWYRQKALACLNQQSWPVAAWYLDRSIEKAPNDRQLRADRALVQERLDLR